MWIRLDDSLLHRRKLRRLGRDAVVFYLAGLLYSGRHKTDGRIDEGDLKEIAHDSWTRESDIRRLVEKLATPDPTTGNPLWEPDPPDGWRIHDWHQYQPSVEEYEASRAARSEAGRRAAKARWDRYDSQCDPQCDSHAQPHATPHATSVRTPSPIPPTTKNVRPALAALPHPTDGTDVADQVKIVATVLEIPGDELSTFTITKAITDHPGTDPIDVATDYQRYRGRTPKERRRDPLEGFQLAMRSATQKGMFLKVEPAEPAEQSPDYEDLQLPDAGTEIWAEIRRDLCSRIGTSSFTHWFAGVADSLDPDGTLDLRFPTDFAAQWVAERLATVVTDAAWDAGHHLPIRFHPPDDQEGAAS